MTKRLRVFALTISVVLLSMLLVSCDTNSSNSDSDGSNIPDSGSFGVPFNTVISYGTLIDNRDGRHYKTVVIGSQIWLARNLNFSGSGGAVGKCYNNSQDSCAKYGRLYTWAEVMGISSSYNSSFYGGHNPFQGICPTGWHVPSQSEWTTLVKVADSNTTVASLKLKSTTGWKMSGNGTDDFGFRALPSGNFGVEYEGIGNVGTWWTSDEASDPFAWISGIGNPGYSEPSAYFDWIAKVERQALRCTKDN